MHLVKAAKAFPQAKFYSLSTGRNIYRTTFFRLQFTSTSPVFTRQNTFEKKLGKMLNKQIIEFELRKPEPCSRTCILTPGYFLDKAKNLKENLQVDFYLLLKYCCRQCTLLSPTWAKSLTTLNTKCKVLNMFWIKL